DLVSRVIEEIICTCDVNFVLLGTGEREFEDFFSGLASRHPGRVCTILKYDKALSKKIYAGSDIFLMPSQSEPCGLSQMIASRYGTVPVVRETGGLFDTIHAYNKYDGTGNGFSFANYNAHEMMAVIKDAIELYHNADAWKALVKNVMAVDFSWNASAEKYIELYKEIMNY
ncbi:MAG: glycosyltransferase, partial [Clostridia bacterium]|nr:glycosyltransferase [Clostridia bacterium]